jgi:aspartate-semialdehyde dehydrogenase
VSASRGLRVAVAGATGILGGEVLSVLDERRFPVSELLPIATERSAAEAVEFQGESFEVVARAPSLRGVDLLLLCAPPAASLDLVRAALRESVRCIDLSGALAGSPDVPLAAADLDPSPEALRSPVLAAPAGPALAWALALAPLSAAAGIVRVVGTGVESASAGGRQGLESLSSESIALFNQQDLPDPSVFSQPVAFDCIPAVGEIEADSGEGATAHERILARDVRRLVGPSLQVAVTTLRVPTFTGSGASLAIELARPLAPEDAARLLAKAPGLALWEGELLGPTTRAVAGSDVVGIGRVRRDPSTAQGLLLWLAADTLRLCAVNGVRLAEARIAAAP